tara:strand:+ start:53 stop:466 length:414 start_codon:yes stop_codon:yes gene_type:complete
MKEYYYKNIDNKLPSNKGFGITFGFIFFAIFLYKFYFSYSFNISTIFLILSIIFFVLSFTKPNSFYLLNKAWMKLGLILSKIFNVIFLFLCYCFIIIPTSFFMKAFFKYDPMNRKKKVSLWIYRKKETRSNHIKDQF